ncbi:MAG: toll/interleukin-1 receptor domain-containing protein, partial [Lachnospiraceae bacterium]|nr:toll/interleukin-1 receptor domain-containing protein [Lachnospiraceae bacterium]
AKNTYTILCNMGYSVWFAPRKIPAGASYTHEIAKELIKDEMDIEDEEANLTHLNNSKALILLLSEASMHSKWVSRELNKAINNDIYVLPLIPTCKQLVKVV